MPFALNDATRFISPTKTPEFLAAGLGVVSTSIPDVVTGVETDVNTLYAHLRVLTGSPHPASHGPAKAGEQRRSVIAIRRAAEVLGWKPEISLEEGLRRTVEFFRARLAS